MMPEHHVGQHRTRREADDQGGDAGRGEQAAGQRVDLGSCTSAHITPTKMMAATTSRRAMRRRVSSAAGSLAEMARVTPPP